MKRLAYLGLLTIFMLGVSLVLSLTSCTEKKTYITNSTIEKCCDHQCRLDRPIVIDSCHWHRCQTGKPDSNGWSNAIACVHPSHWNEKCKHNGRGHDKHKGDTL
jgi:hypothetical protein